MSTNIVNFICSTIMAIVGLFVVKTLSNSKINIFNFKSIMLLLCLIIAPIFVHDKEYEFIYTIIIYAMTIITYKYILNITFMRSIISSGIMIIVIIILDFIASCGLILFVSAKTIRTSSYISLISNLIFAIILFVMFCKTKLGTRISKFINKIEYKKNTRIVVFIIVMIIMMSVTIYAISSNYKINQLFTRNFLMFLSLFLLVLILFMENDSYYKLCDDYDSLFNYVKIFEDWIENEQLNRHEYKNQLAVLRCMTTEKKVKKKIDSIITDYINVDNEMINQLRNLPSGGFKGLLYYKMAIAKSDKIKLEIDVSEESGKVLSKLSTEKQKVLSNLIGIYLDNAIEAAQETRKRIVSMEVYKYEETVNIVISNTYNIKNDISNRYNKGVSTKGKGRGNGLYFANKLLSKNDWIYERQDIVDDFYIEKLKIKTTP